MRRVKAEPRSRKADLEAAILAELRAAGTPVPTPRLVDAVRARVALAGGSLGLAQRQRVWNVLRGLEAAGRVRKAARSVRTGTTWEATDGRG
jgi:hypothetical protein